jgi:hypothetical protein
MKFQFSTPLLYALALLLITISCKDDDPVSKRGLLTGKTWIVVKYEIDGADVTDQREECEKDDSLIFFTDGTFTADIGEVKCDEFDEDSDGTWEFKANETIIGIQPAGEPNLDWNIQELTAGTFRISQYVDLLQAEVVIVLEPK